MYTHIYVYVYMNTRIYVYIYNVIQNYIRIQSLSIIFTAPCIVYSFLPQSTKKQNASSARHHFNKNHSTRKNNEIKSS